MGAENQSSINYFLIVGFSEFPLLQVPLFIAFLLIYLVTLSGNLLIMLTVYANSHLHTPMHFFLTNLSFIDICYISVPFSQILACFFREAVYISMTKCLMQVYFFVGVLATEFAMLAVMAYDRYVAICNPLRYLTIMSKCFCMQLATGSWIAGFLVTLGHTVLISRLSFCENHTLNHFFCDITALLKISCTSTHSVEYYIFTVGNLYTMTTFISIITSYVKITLSILKIKIKGGRHKAFSTCTSHLTVVILLYGSLCATYLRPTSTYSMKENKIVSLIYFTLTPLCNPIIYSLSNTAFKNTLKTYKNTAVVK